MRITAYEQPHKADVLFHAHKILIVKGSVRLHAHRNIGSGVVIEPQVVASVSVEAGNNAWDHVLVDCRSNGLHSLTHTHTLMRLTSLYTLPS